MSSVAGQGFEYHVDLALVVDATGSMTPVLDAVRTAALGFHGEMLRAIDAQGKHVDRVRIRVVLFRDLADHGDRAIEVTPFFELPAEEDRFTSFIRNVDLLGGRTYTESGLAGLSVALHSPWTNGGTKRRHVVVLWTDDQAHRPEDEYGDAPAAFRDQIAPSFDALTDAWHSSQYTSAATRRLVIFGPEGGCWEDLVEDWENVQMFPSQAGQGLSDMELSEIMAGIANSI